MLRNAVQLLKYATAAGVVGGTLNVLSTHNWDVKSIGIIRFGRAAGTVTSVVVDYKWSLYGLSDGTDEYTDTLSETHLRSAKRLKDLCCANGGCFIKVGQHIGALDYLLPKEYVDTMKILHSDAPQSPVEGLYKVIKEDLNVEVEEIFDDFEPTPVGAASLAQVHKAKLKDGTPVAVKVQHPNVKGHAFVDMACMELLVRGVAKIFPEFQFLWLAEETKKNLPKELDFVHEAKNCERVAKMLNYFDFLKIPKVHWDYTSERVLTMEYCEGGQVNDRDYMKKHGINVNEVAKKLGQMYSDMIFVHGYIHCDPHPGNVLVKKTEQGVQIVLLDHGLYQTLTEEFRLGYCKLWTSLIKGDLKKIKKYGERMGAGKLYRLFACMVTARSWKSVSTGIDKEGISDEEDREIRATASTYIPQISEILNSIPRQMLLIFKTNDLLRGIESTLQTRSNTASFITMSEACVRSLFAHKRRKCQSLLCKIKVSVRESYSLLVINFYKFCLWIGAMDLAKRVRQYVKSGIINMSKQKVQEKAAEIKEKSSPHKI